MHMVSNTCQDEEDIKYWDDIIEKRRFSIIKSPIYKDKLTNVIKYISDGSTILDIGFGYGHLEKIINNKHPNITIYGLDRSLKAVKYARKKIRGNFQRFDSYSLPYKNGFFDTILLLDLIEHLNKNEIKNLLLEISRVAKGTSRIIISVPINESKSDYKNNRHKHIFNELILERLMKSYGFNLKRSINLYAFSKNYLLKSTFARLFHIGNPNLLIAIFTR